MTKILMVDDYEEWRRKIRELVQVRPDLQIISEASDGLEGVQRAAELQPDLILLDLGLPELNGIEAARQI
jgi:two-component system nitrate/nitrite response regulator NarL